MQSYKPTSIIFRASSLVCILLACLSVFKAEAQEVRTYSNEFLAIAPGARSQGMGNAFVASTGDAYSVYWNPAGLAQIDNNIQLAFNHSEYFQGLAKYDFGSIAIKLSENSAMGFGLVRFGVDDIPNTLFLIGPDGTVNYDNVTSFSVADYAFFGSYGYGKEDSPLRMGASVKVIRRIVGEFGGAWGFGLDAGLQYDAGNFTFAAMARDITSTFNAWSFDLTDEEKEVFERTSNEIPESSVEVTLPRLIVGTAYNWDISPKFTLISEVNAGLTFDGMRNTLIKSDPVSIDPQMGLEIGYNKLVFLRGGIGNFQEETYFDPTRDGKRLTFQPNVGIGLKIKYFSVDYAFTDVGQQSVTPYSHFISLRFDIDKLEASAAGE